MRDLPDGSFLVRDSLSQSAGTDKEYTLTLRCVQHVEISIARTISARIQAGSNVQLHIGPRVNSRLLVITL